MPLTRNLYLMDEVLSALQTSLRSNNGRALFWLWELAVSNEDHAAKEAALTAWLLWGGGNDPAILTMHVPTTAIAAHNLMYRIQTAIQTARSLNAHRLLTEVSTLTEPPPLTATAIAPPPTPENEDDPTYAPLVWTGLHTAVTTRSRRTAAWYLQAAATTLCPDTVWLFLTSLLPTNAHPVQRLFLKHLQTSATPHTDSQLLSQMNAVFLLCDPLLAITPHPTPSSATLSTRDWDIWTASVGKRKARVHPIPSAALHTRTTRGSLSAAYSNITDLRDLGATLLTNGCNFWRTTLTALGATDDPTTDTLIFPDDDSLESFYATHFPDDIPDEWSLADQFKSHGPGCAETAPPAPLPLPMPDPDALTVQRLAAITIG